MPYLVEGLSINQGTHDRRDDEGQQYRSHVNAAECLDLIQPQSHEQSQQYLNRNRHYNVENGKTERIPEARVAQHINVVFQADPFRRGHIAEGHAMESQLDCRQQGRHHQSQHDDDTRSHKDLEMFPFHNQELSSRLYCIRAPQRTLRSLSAGQAYLSSPTSQSLALIDPCCRN